MATWFQDDWRISNALTLNVGIDGTRTSALWGRRNNWSPGCRATGRIQLDWCSRVGSHIVWANDMPCCGGGYGKCYTQLENDAAHQSNLNIQTIIPKLRSTSGRTSP